MYQKWLEAFNQVASQGSFTGAAHELNVGQPTVSTHVSNLEGRFGVELFHRKGRSITLTAVGESLYAITHNLYGHEQEAIRFLTAARDFKVGELNLSAVGPHDVMELLAAYKDRRPGLKCTVRLGVIDDVLADLEDFRADIGVVGRDCGSETVLAMFYDQHDVLVVVNKTHRLAGRGEIRLADLHGEEMVVRSKNSTTQQAFDEAAAAAGVAVERVFEIEFLEPRRSARSNRPRVRRRRHFGKGIRATSRSATANGHGFRDIHARLCHLSEIAPQPTIDPRIPGAGRFDCRRSGEVATRRRVFFGLGNHGSRPRGYAFGSPVSIKGRLHC